MENFTVTIIINFKDYFPFMSDYEVKFDYLYNRLMELEWLIKPIKAQCILKLKFGTNKMIKLML